jgi:hypothetical protein
MRLFPNPPDNWEPGKSCALIRIINAEMSDNRRHGDMAFDFIRKADLLLFIVCSKLPPRWNTSLGI